MKTHNRVGLQTALAMMIEAYDLMRQPLCMQAEVTPDNPGGQKTATRRDGSKVNRDVFAHNAAEAARNTLMHEKERRRRA